ncbi:MAG: AMP-binding protein [Selenomonadaceae bacterium]|nr:AMP-binding protein [Selenomonadaceae bacterium]
MHTGGHPVKNIKIKILNPDINGIGEILVQGFNLMTCYYKLSEADQSINQDGWLHTGDLGSLQSDGYLKLTGRIKELIIRGGENIMPGEVEAVISKFDIVDNVKVIGLPSDFFGEEVCACIKLKTGKIFDEEKFRAELSAYLARYKIPSKFVIVDEFPMLGTGKIDTVTLKRQILITYI